jgi:hypothetical protein
MLFPILISLTILGLAAGPVYGYFLLKNQKAWNTVLLVVLFALGLGLSFYIFFSTGTFFVAGVTCLMIPLALIVLLFMLFWRRKHLERMESDQAFRRGYWAGTILIPLILALPFFELFWIRVACFELNQRSATPIIAAMETYKNAQGDYPGEIEALVPDYLASTPAGRCAPFSNSEMTKLDFDISTCTPGDVTILSVPIGSGEWIQRYNLKTGLWSRASFLDGACSYLKLID